MARAKSSRLIIFDLLKGWAIFLIIGYHFFLFFSHKAILSRSTGFQENLSRWSNFFNFFWATGYQGVHLFIVISGFLLTLSWKRKKYSLFSFYQKRLKRILIPYYIAWSSCFFLIIISFKAPFLQKFFSVFKTEALIKTLFFPFYFDYSSRFLSQINRAWWFLPLILELYLVFPLLLKIKQKLDLTKFLSFSLIITLSYRFLATYWLKSSPIAVVHLSFGGSKAFIIFLSRSFEFSLGIFLAFLFIKNKNFLKSLFNWPCFLIGVFCQVIGTVLTFYPWGWTISDPLIAIGIFLTSLNLFFMIRKINFIKKAFLFLGRLSYPLYLIHYLLLTRFLVPFLSLNKGKVVYLVLLPVYLIVLVALALLNQNLSQKVAS